MPEITPNLWFDTQSKDAAEFYVSVFPNSEITNVSYYTGAGPLPEGTVMMVDFVLDGVRFTALNGGPQFTFDEAVSFVINCADQNEVDYYWDKLTADGGEESQCGWLKDKFGLSWQVTPIELETLVTGSDRARAERAMKAMFSMQKIDIATIKAAADAA